MQLLGGRDPTAFFRGHWQKRPLLVRGARPGFRGLVDRDELFALACRPDAISRLVIDHDAASRGHRAASRVRGGTKRTRWERHDGPFSSLRASDLPARGWTLLVHGIERLVPSAWELLQELSFLPAARLDDLMVSYAADGGSVGPHDDRYDVFLLQGEGRRRWQIARGGDRALDPRAAIKVLARFAAEEEWTLDPGDMLYLPPGVAHHGVAEGPCFTYSIGLLAPSARDLVESFLGYLGGTLPIDDALYADPSLRPPRDRAALPDAMIEWSARVLGRVKWDRRVVEDFLGCFLTRPRPNDRSSAPKRPLTVDAFAARLARKGTLGLAPASRALWHADRFYLDGEAQHVRGATRDVLRALARDRRLVLPLRAPSALAHALYAAYVRGALVLSR